MAKVSQRIKRSYEAYLNYRRQARNKGYGLDRQLTLEEYKGAHEDFSHKGATHIARTIATGEKTATRNEAAAIIRRLKTADQYDNVDQEALAELRSTYKTARDIYSLELTDWQASLREQERRHYWTDRGIEPEFTIQASARALLFNQLRDAGLSYKEAEEVIYG